MSALNRRLVGIWSRTDLFSARSATCRRPMGAEPIDLFGDPSGWSNLVQTRPRPVCDLSATRLRPGDVTWTATFLSDLSAT